ncbi:MAG: PhzF family phenazine biosynthesis protein [Myxococcales bacterium]|nr:PhzF family phenazine biosynthesis protein [Myxococcales bacterium]
MSDTIPCCLYDVFAERPFSGERVAVFSEATRLAPEEMEHLARELGAPATAFVTNCAASRLDARFFGPLGELEFSAGAALSAVAELARQGKLTLADGKGTTRLFCRAGEFSLSVELHPVAETRVSIEFSGIRFAPYRHRRELLAGCLGLEATQLPPGWPLAMACAGRWALVVPVDSRATLEAARPDFASLAELNRKIGVSLTQLYTFSGPSAFHGRALSPASGVFECAASGAGFAACAALLARENSLRLTPPLSIVEASAGAAEGRPAAARLEVRHGSGVESVRLFATVVRMGEGSLRPS